MVDTPLCTRRIELTLAPSIGQIGRNNHCSALIPFPRTLLYVNPFLEYPGRWKKTLRTCIFDRISGVPSSKGTPLFLHTRYRVGCRVTWHLAFGFYCNSLRPTRRSDVMSEYSPTGLTRQTACSTTLLKVPSIYHVTQDDRNFGASSTIPDEVERTTGRQICPRWRRGKSRLRTKTHGQDTLAHLGAQGNGSPAPTRQHIRLLYRASTN